MMKDFARHDTIATSMSCTVTDGGAEVDALSSRMVILSSRLTDLVRSTIPGAFVSCHIVTLAPFFDSSHTHVC